MTISTSAVSTSAVTSATSAHVVETAYLVQDLDFEISIVIESFKSSGIKSLQGFVNTCFFLEGLLPEGLKKNGNGSGKCMTYKKYLELKDKNESLKDFEGHFNIANALVSQVRYHMKKDEVSETEESSELQKALQKCFNAFKKESSDENYSCLVEAMNSFKEQE